MTPKVLPEALIEELLAAAGKAGGREWFTDPKPTKEGLAIVDDGASMWPIKAEWPQALFIALANPQTVSALIAEVKAARASRVLQDEGVVAWRPVSELPVAMSVLARFFDNELGEWVYTVIDPGPPNLSIAAPYSEWLPLDTFNRRIFTSARGGE